MSVQTCKHCQKSITHFNGRLWHDDGKVFPQYCHVDMERGSRLHEPLIVENANQLRVLDLVGSPGMLFIHSSPEAAKRYTMPHIRHVGDLDRETLECVLKCGDFDSIGTDRDREHFLIFYKA